MQIAERPTKDQIDIFRTPEINQRLATKIVRIESILDFLTLERMQVEYLLSTKKILSRFIDSYKQILEGKQRTSYSISCFFHERDSLSLQIKALKSLQYALERLGSKILRYPQSYCTGPKDIITEPPYLPLPARNRIQEQNILSNLREWLSLKHISHEELYRIYEIVNWFYDQNAIHELSFNTRMKIVYFVNRYISALIEFNATPSSEEYFQKKMCKAQEAVMASKLALCLSEGMQEHRKYYLNPKIKSTLAVRASVS